MAIKIGSESQTTAAIARHVDNATRYLAQALHYHRAYTGAVNTRRVAAIALEAGQSARFSGQLCEAWAERCPEAWAVTEIREAMRTGWVATDRDLTSCIDVVDPGSVAS